MQSCYKASMDNHKDFNRLIILAFNETSNEKDLGRQYCEHLKNSQDGWKLCLENLCFADHESVRFWCLNVTLHVITTRYPDFNEEQRGLIRNNLMIFVRDVCAKTAQPNYIKNTLATAIIRVIKHDYPELWPSFFNDLLSVLQNGPEVIDIFFRVLNTFDDEIVEFDVKRSQAEVKHNTYIKDTFRSAVLSDIVDTWYNILLAGHQAHAALSVSCLQTMQKFIGWVDIQYFITPRFLDMLFGFLSDSNLQIPACDCIFEIVRKRMPCENKILVLKQLRLFDALSSIRPNSLEFATALAGLINLLGIQLVGNATNSEMMWTAMRLAIAYLDHECYSVCDEINPLLNKFINWLKRNSDQALEHTATVSAILQAILRHEQYPSNYNFDHPAEVEEDFLQFRYGLDNTFKNLVRFVPDVTIQFTKTHLQAVLDSLSTKPFTEVEAILHLLHILPECLRNYNSMLESGPLMEMVYAIVARDLSQYPNDQVVMEYFAVIVRYSRFLSHHSMFVGPVLQRFIGNRGMLNTNRTVRSRACYFLLRLLQSFLADAKSTLAPFVDEILSGLLPLVDNTLGQPNSRPIVEKEDTLALCEIMGILTSEGVVADKSPQYISTVLQSNRARLEALLSHTGSSLDSNQICIQVADVIDGVGCYSKAFRAQDGSTITSVFETFMPVVIQAFLMFPSHPSVRGRFIFYLHRMVACMGSQLLNFFPASFDVLIEHTTSNNVLELLQLLGQLVIKLKNMLQVIDHYFLSVINRTFQCMRELTHADPNNVPEAAYSADKCKLTTVYKGYYTFLHTLVEHGMKEVFVSNNNKAHFINVLETLLSGCHDPPEIAVHKTCFSILMQLIPYTLSLSDPLITPQISSLVFSRLFPASFATLRLPHFNILDANCDSCFSQIIEFQCAVVKALPHECSNNVCEIVSSATLCGPHIAQEYYVFLTKHEVRPIKNFLSGLLRSS